MGKQALGLLQIGQVQPGLSTQTAACYLMRQSEHSKGVSEAEGGKSVAGNELSDKVI